MAYKENFANAVRAGIARREITYREVARQTDLSPAYVADCVQGRVPRREVVLRLADALRVERNQLLEAAGMEPEAEREASPQERLLDWTQDYERRWGEPMRVKFQGGAGSLSHEDVDRIIALHEREAEESAQKGEKLFTESRKD